MRRRIRLTGRRQLSKSAVKVTLSELAGKPLLTMIVVQPDAFRSFPPESKVSLRLIENKGVEIVDLGTIGKLHTSRQLQARVLAPTCQLRIADPGLKSKGLLLASTDSWTLRADDETDDGSSKGILQFLAADTAPQSWKLEIKEADYPIVRVDRRIPNAALWARNDPVFIGTALPSIVRQVFDEILRGEYSEDIPWVSDWLRWADTIAPGEAPPIEQDKADRADYLERLLDSFCSKYELAEKLLKAAMPEDLQ